MRSPKRWRTITELIDGMADVAGLLKWERESLELFHAYCQKFDGRPGQNVFTHVLRDALRLQGLTLEQFKAQARKK